MTPHPFTVLVGVDGTPPSMHAVRYALRLCTEAGPRSRLHLCHVLPPPEDARGSVLPSMPAAIRDGFLLEAQAEARTAGFEPSVELMRGEAADTLVKRARSLDADLLLIGNARRNAAADAMRGTVAIERLASCPCPVVLVP